MILIILIQLLFRKFVLGASSFSRPQCLREDDAAIQEEDLLGPQDAHRIELRGSTRATATRHDPGSEHNRDRGECPRIPGVDLEEKRREQEGPRRRPVSRGIGLVPLLEQRLPVEDDSDGALVGGGNQEQESLSARMHLPLVE